MSVLFTILLIFIVSIFVIVIMIFRMFIMAKNAVKNKFKTKQGTSYYQSFERAENAEKPMKRKQRVFEENEGEYVDFEEIKE